MLKNHTAKGVVMGRTIVKIYGDGEFWIDGQKRAKLYSDGDIYADGRRIGRLYPDGDIYIDGKRVGKVYPDGEVWVGDQRVATGVYLLDLLEGSGGTGSSSGQGYSAGGSGFGGSSGFGGGNRLNDLAEVGSSGFGLGLLVVIVLLIVASLYACFKLWTSEIPQLIFGNMNVLGPVATVAVYAGMLFTMYWHCCIATKSKEEQFVRGVLMQAGVFFANVIVFTILDLIATALSYGFSVGDALGEIGNALAGSLLGMLVIAVFIGMAPTIVSSLISRVCIKKGVVVPFLSLPRPARRPTVHKPSARRSSTYQPGASAPKKRPASIVQGTTIRFTESAPGWDWTGLGAKLTCVPFVGILVFASASLPESLFMEPDYASLTLLEWVLPVAAVAAGVLIRRNMWRSRRTFVKEWLIQFAAQLAACVLKWGFRLGFDSVFYMTELLLQTCGVLLFVGLLITVFTKPYVD